VRKVRPVDPNIGSSLGGLPAKTLAPTAAEPMKANRAYNRKTPLPLLDANLLPPATIGAALEQGSIPTPADIVCELPQKRAYKQRTTVAVDPSTAGTPSPKQAGPKRRGRG
jgi:hypothetical protein